MQFDTEVPVPPGGPWTIKSIYVHGADFGGVLVNFTPTIQSNIFKIPMSIIAGSGYEKNCDLILPMPYLIEGNTYGHPPLSTRAIDLTRAGHLIRDGRIWEKLPPNEAPEPIVIKVFGMGLRPIQDTDSLRGVSIWLVAKDVNELSR